jgi:ABC-type antimicrobial peptide transport system permease subunit
MGEVKPYPPNFFLRFFRWYCHPRLTDHIEGDLIEVYRKRVHKNGKRNADIRFVIDVLLLFRPGIIRPAEGYKNLNNYGMYKSYFKVGWRNLVKNKGYSLINIGGLAIGMAVAMLIGLWIYDELEFNKYHKNYNTIARVLRNGTANGETFTHPSVPYALGDELKTKYGNNFKHVVTAWHVGDHILSAGEKNFSFSGEFIEPAGPEMFSLQMLRGSWSALKDQHSILLSCSAAEALFGNDDSMDKILKIDNNMDVKVAGVYEDLPPNTHFHGVKFFAPMDLLISVNEWVKQQNFGTNFLNIYVAIADHTSFDYASHQIKDAILNNIQDDKTYVSIRPQIFLSPMKDWHLRSEWKNGFNTGGLIQIVWLFGIVGAFVLLLACINFMNLSTARSEKRAKEVGIRKSMGSIRSQLMNQFFSESFVVVVLAFIFAFIIVSSSLNSFNALAGKQMPMPWANVYFWLSIIIFIFVTGLLAGSYPALYLSSFNPVKVLKGSLRVGRYASIPRKVLVVIQFTVSVTLIIGTIIVYEQIQFAKNRPVGYDRNGLLMIQMKSPDFYGKYDVLRTELKATGVVTEMAESSSPTTDIWNSNGGFNWKGKDPDLIAEFATFTVTPEYGKTIGWQFVQGRDFSTDHSSDSAGFVINEAAAKLLGFENPVGEVMEWSAGYRSRFTRFTVLGVIKDMVVKSPYTPAVPSVFLLSPNGTNWINIRINPEISTADALLKIEGVFKKIIPSVPFDYKFADEEYALKFAAEERVGKLASVFAVLALIISSLGLFGLASFVAEQRTKEIGIRKVVGASVFNIWKMLSKDFVVLVVISCLIAIPIAYYFLATWLKQYEYRTEISWWVFVVTSLAALMITLLTVTYQAVKAALMKPVKSLRSE